MKKLKLTELNKQEKLNSDELEKLKGGAAGSGVLGWCRCPCCCTCTTCEHDRGSNKRCGKCDVNRRTDKCSCPSDNTRSNEV